MQADLWSLYKLMLRSRQFEEAVTQLWDDGLIFGEMHTGIGEEAIAAGIVGQLMEGDAMALDHRGTPPLIMRGIDPVALLLEFLGHPGGLCRGMGGHMHLFWPEGLSASSGIVGASGPTAVGFALAASRLRPGTLTVAFFGEGAFNQGMMMESMNLASAWRLPVIFVCKDSQWAITTLSRSVTAGSLIDRARSFGMPAFEVDGSDVEAVWLAGKEATGPVRKGKGPAFLLAGCTRPQGHFLCDPLIHVCGHPVSSMKDMAAPMLRSVTRIKGASVSDRANSIATITKLLAKTVKGQVLKKSDPLKTVRDRLKSDQTRLKKLEKDVNREIQTAVEKALEIDDSKTGRES